MASLGDLVVHLKANSAQFNRGIQKARSTIGGFAQSVAAIATGGAAVGLLKLAADAETTAVQFRVLLGNAADATKMISQIDKFASKTPFAKLDVAGAAQTLLAFQFAQEDVLPTLQNLGDVAAGSGAQINDLATILGRATATGKVQGELLNQLIERRVPILDALSQVTGVASSKIQKMGSDGQLTGDHLRQAFQLMTQSGGQFSGGMDQLSQTTAGQFSTLKDNITLLATEMGSVLLPAANAAMSKLTEGMESAKSVTQDFGITSSGVIQWFSNAWQTVTDGLAVAITGSMAIAEFAMTNWQSIAELAVTNAMLSFVQLGSHIQHFFTGVLPSLLTWFADNWQSVFFTAFDFVATGFINVGQNIRNIWSSILDFITGSSEGLNFTWTPLLEGFRNTISQMPEIPDRAISELERNLSTDAQRLGNTLGQSFEDIVGARLDTLAEMQATSRLVGPADMVSTAGVGGLTSPGVAASGYNKATKRQVLGVAQRGSAEAFKIIANAGKDQKLLKESQKQTKKLEEIAKNTKNRDALGLEVQGPV